MSGRILLCTILAFGGDAAAREVDWADELLVDGALIASTVVIDRTSPKGAGVDRADFPTQGFDDTMRDRLHGPKSTAFTTKQEARYRNYSNVSVAGAVILPAALSLFDEDAAGKVMVVAHSMLIENFIVTGIKCSVRRPRPKPTYNPDVPAAGDDTRSFPSGHASAAFAGATLFSRLFPAAPLAVKLGTFGLAAFTALARIEGDKHFFTDTAVGALIGSGAAWSVTAWHRDSTPPRLSLTLEADKIGLSYALP